MSWPMPIGSSPYCIDRRLGYKKSCIEWDALLTRYIGLCLPSTYAIRFLVAYTCTKPRRAFNRTLFISSCRACRPMRIAIRIRLPTPCCVKTKTPYSCRYLSNLHRFSKFFLGLTLVNLQIIIPPHLGYVATLHCETLIPENKRLTINYKLE